MPVVGAEHVGAALESGSGNLASVILEGGRDVKDPGKS